MRKKSVYVMSSLLAIALVGCGGSNGSKDKGTDKQINISGVAVDDVIVNGDVVAYPAGKPDQILARGKTDAKSGSYLLQLSHEGVVVVKVTCGDEGKMFDPDTKKTEECEQNLALRSAASVTKEASKVSINVSPVSELLVSNMENKMGGSKDIVSAFKEAREEVGQVFDIDPVLENPLNNIKYKQTVKSFRTLADTKHTTLKEVIDDLSDDLADGVTGDDNNIAVDLATLMINEGVVSTLTQKKGKVEVQIPEKGTNPNPKPKLQPKPVSQEEQLKADIKASKAFFDVLRTQAMSVVDYNQSGTPGFLDIEAEKLSKTLEDVSLNANIAGEYSVKIIDAIMHAIDENKTNAGKFFDNDDESRRYEIDKDDDTHWNYTIFYNEGKVAEGTITLPTKNSKSITPGNFTTLHARVDGDLPKKSAYQIGEKTQHVSLDATITKTDSGATLEVSELSLSDEDTSTALKNLKGKVGYTYDKTKPEDEQVGMRFIEFDSGMMEGKVPGYEINGSIVIPEYVINSGIQGKGFIEEKYTTYINGSISCLGAHNQRVPMKDAEVTYVDKDGVEHQMPVQIDGQDRGNGYFNQDFEGNIAGLDENHDHMHSSYYQENWSQFLGLKFDNIELKSSTCQDIKLENVNYRHEENSTQVHISAFCADNGFRNMIEDLEASYTDSNGVKHIFDKYGFVSFNDPNNVEQIPLSDGYKKFYVKDELGINFDRIQISANNCANPAIMQLSFHTSLNNNDSTYMTDLNMNVGCVDDSKFNGQYQNWQLVYTDELNQTHQLHLNGPFYKKNFSGNLENLALTVGELSYNAPGFIRQIKDNNFTIQSNSCANPILTHFNIHLDSDENFYNSGKLPKKVLFEGTIVNTKTKSQLSGMLSVDWLNAATFDFNAENPFPHVDVTYAGMLKRAGYKDMTLMLGYKNATERNLFSFSYAYDATSINGTGDFDKEMKNGLVKLNSHNGIEAKIAVKDGDVVYGSKSSVTKDNRKIGELQDRKDVPVIKYEDGTFESLP